MTVLFHHFKTSFRYLSRHLTFTSLNVLSLALGMAASLLIYQYVSYHKGFDNFHENAQQIYRVITHWNPQQTPNDHRATSVYWSGPGVSEALPEVVNYTQLAPLSTFISESWVKRENTSLGGLNMYLADSNFFQIFNFKSLDGDPQQMLKDKFSIILTESNSKKLFGEDNPVGQLVELKPSGNFMESPYGKASFKVTGIVQDPPANSHLQFDALISKNSIWDFNSGSMYWHWDYLYTYLKVRPGTDPQVLGKKISDLRLSLFGEEFGVWNDQIAFELQALSTIHTNNDLRGELSPSSDAEALFLLSLIMLCILGSAYVNYLNLVTAKILGQKKETGLRKILGSSKRQLIAQLLIESLILNVLALGLATLLVQLSIPLLESLFDFVWPVSFAAHFSGSMILKIALVVICGIILSALYPALVMLSFKPREVLKRTSTGARKGSNHWMMRKAMIVFQFGFCIAFVLLTVVLQRQLSHMKNHDLGFNANQLMVVPAYGLDGQEGLQRFKNRALASPGIQTVSWSSAVPGSEINLLGLKHRMIENNMPVSELKIVSVDQEFFETLEIDLLAGEVFDKKRSTDSFAVMLNEEAARLMGWENALAGLGKTIALSDGSVKRKVTGIVKNYHQLSLRRSFEPLIFVPAWEWNRTWMDWSILIKLSSNEGFAGIQHAMQELEKSWQETARGMPFHYFFLDDYFNRQYQEERSFSSLFVFFSSFSIFIALLGLFGMVAHTTLQRTKEIGIRKILGATVRHILALISREFAVLLLIANVLVLPICWLLMQDWLTQYAFATELNMWLFFVPAMAIVALSLSIVVVKSLGVARANPVDSIRHE